MKCENSYCVYQHRGKCTLKEIEIDISGMCAACIYIDLDESILDKAKEKLLKLYDVEE